MLFLKSLTCIAHFTTLSGLHAHTADISLDQKLVMFSDGGQVNILALKATSNPILDSASAPCLTKNAVFYSRSLQSCISTGDDVKTVTMYDVKAPSTAGDEFDFKEVFMPLSPSLLFFYPLSAYPTFLRIFKVEL